jgi:hypothetical protein
MRVLEEPEGGVEKTALLQVHRFDTQEVEGALKKERMGSDEVEIRFRIRGAAVEPIETSDAVKAVPAESREIPDTLPGRIATPAEAAQAPLPPVVRRRLELYQELPQKVLEKFLGKTEAQALLRGASAF